MKIEVVVLNKEIAIKDFTKCLPSFFQYSQGISIKVLKERILDYFRNILPDLDPKEYILSLSFSQGGRKREVVEVLYFFQILEKKEKEIYIPGKVISDENILLQVF